MKFVSRYFLESNYEDDKVHNVTMTLFLYFFHYYEEKTTF